MHRRPRRAGPCGSTVAQGMGEGRGRGGTKVLWRRGIAPRPFLTQTNRAPAPHLTSLAFSSITPTSRPAHNRPSSLVARWCTSQPMPSQQAAVRARPHMLGVVHPDGQELPRVGAVQHWGNSQGLHKLLKRAGLHQAWRRPTSGTRGGTRGPTQEGTTRKKNKARRGGGGEDSGVRGEPQDSG